MNDKNRTIPSVSDLVASASKRHELQERWQSGKKTGKRWQIIRDAYSYMLPHILQHRCDPYFLEWDFTPIEFLAWQDIRGLGIPLYPQFPALHYFIDFADPILQIGVELDGKDYHDPAKDERRDQELWAQGWRIFRIPGRNALPARESPVEPSDAAAERMREDPDSKYRLFSQWGERWSEGFFWALKAFYYGPPVDPELSDAAARILNRARLAQFPLELEGGE